MKDIRENCIACILAGGMSTRYAEKFAKQIAPIIGKPAFVHTANALREAGLSREDIFVETTEADIAQQKVIGAGIELYAKKECIPIIKHKQMPDVDVILKAAEKAVERKKEFVMILYADALYPIKFLKEALRAASRTLSNENDAALMGITTCLDEAVEYDFKILNDDSVESISDDKKIKTRQLFATIILRTKCVLELGIDRGVERKQVGALYIAKQLINSGKKVYANETIDLKRPYLHYNDISAYHRVIQFIEDKPEGWVEDEYGIKREKN